MDASSIFPILDDSEHSVLFENNETYPLREVQIGPVVEQMILFHCPPEGWLIVLRPLDCQNLNPLSHIDGKKSTLPATGVAHD